MPHHIYCPIPRVSVAFEHQIFGRTDNERKSYLHNTTSSLHPSETLASRNADSVAA